MFAVRQLAVLFFLITTSLIYADTVEARPASAWRSRSTGLSSTGQCTRRAFRAMRAANLNYETSDDFGVKGKDSQTIAYILCFNSGSRAVIFCATDESSAGSVCNILARYMES